MRWDWTNFGRRGGRKGGREEGRKGGREIGTEKESANDKSVHKTAEMGKVRQKEVKERKKRKREKQRNQKRKMKERCRNDKLNQLLCMNKPSSLLSKCTSWISKSREKGRSRAGAGQKPEAREKWRRWNKDGAFPPSKQSWLSKTTLMTITTLSPDVVYGCCWW